MIDRCNELILQAVAKALNEGVRFYCYRLPGEKELNFGVQTDGMNKKDGFCVHPFVEGDVESVFISNDVDADEYLMAGRCGTSAEEWSGNIQSSIQKSDYMKQADACIAEMKKGNLAKVVLSRTIAGESADIVWGDVFCELLDSYRNAFVFVYHSQETGAWMGATPEKLLCNRGGNVSTMALAGTRIAGTQGEWGQKEIDEQRMVTDYICRCFENAGIEYGLSPLYTRNAGNVEHLCNDFSGYTDECEKVEVLKNELHPTPAIAGVPCKEAVDYIGKIEMHSRRCYGGYIGPVHENGDFDMFVNLRSIEFDKNRYCLYVGGGLTASSEAEKEWQETAEKAKTLQRFLL